MSAISLSEIQLSQNSDRWNFVKSSIVSQLSFIGCTTQIELIEPSRQDLDILIKMFSHKDYCMKIDVAKYKLIIKAVEDGCAAQCFVTMINLLLKPYRNGFSLLYLLAFRANNMRFCELAVELIRNQSEKVLFIERGGFKPVIERDDIDHIENIPKVKHSMFNSIFNIFEDLSYEDSMIAIEKGFKHPQCRLDSQSIVNFIRDSGLDVPPYGPLEELVLPINAFYVNSYLDLNWNGHEAVVFYLTYKQASKDKQNVILSSSIVPRHEMLYGIFKQKEKILYNAVVDNRNIIKLNNDTYYLKECFRCIEAKRDISFIEFIISYFDKLELVPKICEILLPDIITFELLDANSDFYSKLIAISSRYMNEDSDYFIKDSKIRVKYYNLLVRMLSRVISSGESMSVENDILELVRFNVSSSTCDDVLKHISIYN